MTRFKNIVTGLLCAMLIASTPALAADEHSTVALQGYDAVSYFVNHQAEKGNGNHVAVHKGVNYLFTSDEHKKQFEANPEKYAPQYGGWCAFGTSVNKKFIGDPTVWKIVDGKLYVNLDRKIYDMWIKDVPGNIQKADTNWMQIESTPVEELNGK